MHAIVHAHTLPITLHTVTTAIMSEGILPVDTAATSALSSSRLSINKFSQ